MGVGTPETSKESASRQTGHPVANTRTAPETGKKFEWFWHFWGSICQLFEEMRKTKPVVSFSYLNAHILQWLLFITNELLFDAIVYHGCHYQHISMFCTTAPTIDICRINRYGAHKSIRISRPLCLPWPADDGINFWRCICTTHILKRLDYIFCGTCMWRHLVW